MLLPRETLGVQLEEGTSVLDNQVVDDDNNDPDDEESGVVEEVGEDVFLVVDLPCSNHVDNLEPDEQIEDESHVARGVSIDSGLFEDSFVQLFTVDTVLTAREDLAVLLHMDVISVLVELKLLIGLHNQVLTSEEEDEQNDHLEQRHVEDVLTHLAGDNEIILALRHAVQQVITRQLSGKGE